MMQKIAFTLVVWAFAGLAHAYTMSDYNEADHVYRQAVTKIAELEASGGWMWYNQRLSELDRELSQGERLCGQYSSASYNECVEGYRDERFSKGLEAQAIHEETMTQIMAAQGEAAGALEHLNRVIEDLRAQGLM